MKDSVRVKLSQLPCGRNWVDEILEIEASKYMIHFDLNEFKKDYPSLYITIRESILKSRML